jgi:hypothetical protein
LHSDSALRRKGKVDIRLEDTSVLVVCESKDRVIRTRLAIDGAFVVVLGVATEIGVARHLNVRVRYD